jgi:hypothetical protein
VKITVIAPGFGPPAAARPAATGSGAQTPVDMTQYAHVGRLRADPSPLAPGDRVATPRLSVARRPAFDLPLAVAAPGSSVPQPGTETEADPDASSAFDVPAFLRRQEG